jgi:hypothetical protein
VYSGEYTDLAETHYLSKLLKLPLSADKVLIVPIDVPFGVNDAASAL